MIHAGVLSRSLSPFVYEGPITRTASAAAPAGTALAGYTGHPAASTPAGFAGGLPVGMQIIGPRLRDDGVLAASADFDALRPRQDGSAGCHERPL